MAGRGTWPITTSGSGRSLAEGGSRSRSVRFGLCRGGAVGLEDELPGARPTGACAVLRD